jgi:hypothetical protein
MENVKDELFDEAQTSETDELLSNEKVNETKDPLDESLEEIAEEVSPDDSDDLVDTKVSSAEVVIGGFSDRPSYDIDFLADEDIEELEIETIDGNTKVVEKVKVTKKYYKIDTVDKGEEKLKYLLDQGKQPEVFSPNYPDFKGFKMNVAITYKDCNYASYMPSIAWVYNVVNNQVAYNPSIKKIKQTDIDGSQYTQVIQKLKIQVAEKLEVDVFKFKDSSFLAILGLCEARLLVKEYEFNGRKTRLDWYDFKLDVEEAKKLL